MKEIKELWMFVGWNNLSQAKRREVKNSRTTDVVFGLNFGNDGNFKHLNKERLIKDVQWCQNNNIRIHLMPWMIRNKDFIVSCYENLQEFLELMEMYHIDIKSVLLDAEKDWFFGDDLLDLDDAIKLTKNFKFKLKNKNIELGVTSLLKIQEPIKPLAKLCDYVLPQAYSVYFQNKSNHWSHNEVFTPGISQEVAYNSWSKYNNNIVMGLAIYNEYRPPLNGHRGFPINLSLETSLNVTKSIGVDRIAYWDLNKIIGKGHKTAIRREFLYTIMNSNTFVKQDWKTIQKALKLINCNPGPIDGIFGPKTGEALERFRHKNNLNRNVEVNEKDLVVLLRLVRF